MTYLTEPFEHVVMRDGVVVVAQGLRLEWWPVEKAVAAVWDGQVQLAGSALALLACTTRRLAGSFMG
ncbi:MAG: hypothetical protein QG622_2717 [Actinomycetota bacterium]|nr:hypothetical protein [Actinomycetota bacterium]